MAVARDASSPARVVTSVTGTVDSGTTAAFSPPANSWLFLSRGANENAGGTITFTTPTNTGTALTWTQVANRTNASGGGAVVWRAFNASAQTGITVSSSLTYSGSPPSGSSTLMWVDVWTGAATTQTGAASSTSTSTTQTNNPTVTTTASGSQVAGMLLDWGATGTCTSSDTIDSSTVAGSTSAARAYKASNSGAAGSVTLNMVTGGSGSINSIIVYEILAAASGVSASSATTDGADVVAASVGPRVDASSAKTDGADVLASSVGPRVDASSAKTDGADILGASVGPQVAASSATTDGADVAAAAVTVSSGVSASSATTDGFDVLSAAVGPQVTASSNTTDGADTLASSVGPQVSASSATTDGADTAAASVAVSSGVSASSATTDGADVLSAQIGPQVGATSSTTDGADSLVAAVAPLDFVGISAALVDDADLISARVDTGTPTGGGISRKVAIEHRGKLILFETEEEAEQWMQALAPKQEQIIAKLAKKAVSKVAGLNVLQRIVFDAPKVIEGIPQIKALASMRASLLQGMLDQSIADQLAKEQADRDDEEMAQVVLFMMG